MRPDVAAVIASLAVAEAEAPRGVMLPSTGNDPAPRAPAGEREEPTYGRAFRDNVQGNIIPGFNKDHQHFAFLRIDDVRKARQWLRRVAPLLATMDDVLAFVRAHRAQRLRTGRREPELSATWTNLALSYGGIAKLAGKAEADAFGDLSFKQGLAARSELLGDPSTKSHPGHRSKWKVGGRPEREADVMVMVASDEASKLRDAARDLIADVRGHGMSVVFEQRCATLPGSLRGHEHFGFKDGVSQPGVRGKVSSAPGDFITPRYLAAGDPHARLFAKPGQPLIWPGQFVLGEPRQDPQDLFEPAPAARNFPAWAKGGSYLVCRRLRQDVEAFWEFVVDTATAFGDAPAEFASMLVGRWPSGAPFMRTPKQDDAALAGDEFANNHFLFEDDTRPSVLRPIPGYAGDSCRGARADVLGRVCPHFAHVRKVNPRDGGTDLGTPADTLLRLLLRRGIPFGPPVAGVRDPSPYLLRRERGLMFISFAATIEDQFEFLTKRWTNSALHPRFGGHDPIMGQRDSRGLRTRYIDVPAGGGSRRVQLDREWVVPTGGGYFFAPPISAIATGLTGR